MWVNSSKKRSNKVQGCCCLLSNELHQSLWRRGGGGGGGPEIVSGDNVEVAADDFVVLFGSRCDVEPKLLVFV
jgi:hypothetical protein